MREVRETRILDAPPDTDCAYPHTTSGFRAAVPVALIVDSENSQRLTGLPAREDLGRICRTHVLGENFREDVPEIRC